MLCLETPGSATGSAEASFAIEFPERGQRDQSKAGLDSEAEHAETLRSVPALSAKTDTIAAPAHVKTVEWEKHTRGIGSRLLAKMGYTGAGLGKHEDGIVDPIKVKMLADGTGIGFEPPDKKVKKSLNAADEAALKAAKLASMSSDQRAELAVAAAGSDKMAQAAAERKSRSADLFQVQSDIERLTKQLRKLRKVSSSVDCARTIIHHLLSHLTLMAV